MKKMWSYALILLVLSDLFLSGALYRKEKKKEDNAIADLLQIAKEPLGHTMYVWGGGWNEEDTTAGKEARSLGLSPRWEEFASGQDKTYDYRKTRYQIHDGLDCSGYIGWVVYNLLEDRDGNKGYVENASRMAESLSKRGLGQFTPAGKVEDWQAGDIMSMEGHVWMALGSCKDGSVVLIHASPPGVILSGTTLPDGRMSMAQLLAGKYMSSYYPDWYARYPESGVDHSYLTHSSRMRWGDDTLSDVQGLRKMNAEKVLEWLFEE
ncbi:MAG: hypothetical protein ACI4DN_11770 [Lachnospiraceae bacterium]